MFHTVYFQMINQVLKYFLLIIFDIVKSYRRVRTAIHVLIGINSMYLCTVHQKILLINQLQFLPFWVVCKMPNHAKTIPVSHILCGHIDDLLDSTFANQKEFFKSDFIFEWKLVYILVKIVRDCLYLGSLLQKHSALSCIDLNLYMFIKGAQVKISLKKKVED